MPDAKTIRATAAEHGLAFSAACTIRAEDAASGSKRVPAVDMVLYSGGPIRQWWSDVPMVVDLKGFDTSRQQVPINYVHNTQEPACLLGQTTAVRNDGKAITLQGQLLNAASPIMQHVVDMARAGFQWQASVGGDVDETEYVPEKTVVTVNGRKFTGPMLVIRSGRLREATICQQGADPNTSVAIAAQANGGSPMPKPQDPAPGNEPTKLAAGSPAPIAASAAPPATEPIVSAKGGDGASGGNDLANEILKAQLAEANARREAAQLELERVKALAAHRESLPAAPAGHIAGQSMAAAGVKAAGMVAALCMAAGMPDEVLRRRFKESELTAGDDLRAEVSLQQCVLKCARERGWTGPENRITAGNCRQVLQAAFSSHEISVALGSAYGKFVLDSYELVTNSDPWRLIYTPRNVNDFKAITGVRTLGDFSFKRATNSGKLEDAALKEDSTTLKADLWGRLTTFTMEDMVNDDTGRLNELGTQLGDGAGIGFLEDFYSVLIAAIGNSYYLTQTPAAGNALSLTSLKAAKAKLERQKNSAGKPIVLQGRLLLVPPELETTATDLMKPGNILITGESKTIPNSNSLAGRYAVASTQFLTSTTGWALVGGRPTMAPMQVAWLDGVSTPTIQSVDPMYDTLGFVIRGWMAWGCKANESQSLVWNEVS